MRLPLILLALTLGTASAAQSVTSSIPPLAGIIGDLTRGVATSESLLPANTDPHHFNLAPSQIRAIHTAPRIYAVGQDMEPWLERLTPQLPEGTLVNLGEIEDVHSYILQAREFGDMDETANHDEHADQAQEDAYGHGINDPHMWLSPTILSFWAEEITRNLVIDMPVHADALNANLTAYRADLAQINTEMAALYDAFSAQNIRVVVNHDAFQYLEAYLNIPQAGMFSDSHDNAAGARSISAISHLTGNICLIVDPNEPLPEGILPDAKRAEIDPLGNVYTDQAHFTLSFFHGITEALKQCL